LNMEVGVRGIVSHA